ncbi:MAG: hypothetical protein U0T56_00685 [Ferruginibacter sp.]
MKIMNTFTSTCLAAGAFIFSLLNWLHKLAGSSLKESSGLNKDLIIANTSLKKAEASKFIEDSYRVGANQRPGRGKGVYKNISRININTPDAGGNQVFFSSVAMDSKFFDALNTLFEPKGFRIYLMATLMTL